MLPSTIKKEASEDADAPGSSSYKKKKELKDKANSSRSLRSPSLWALTQASATLTLPLPGCRGALAPCNGFSLSSRPSLSLSLLICRMARLLVVLHSGGLVGVE